MTEDDQKLILNLATGAISKAEFLREYPFYISEDRKHIRELICNAISRRDGGGIEYAFLLGFSFGFPENFTNLLCILLEAEWHQKHEDIARLLQNLRDPISVDALFRATKARHPYLEYNNNIAFAIKCVWALSEIDDRKALDKLRLIAETDDREDVRAIAMSRLGKL
jgi:hypothetical protein